MLGFVDEQLAVGGEDHLTEAIVEDITRQRVGEMRQIISTITPEQYELITRPPDGDARRAGRPRYGQDRGRPAPRGVAAVRRPAAVARGRAGRRARTACSSPTSRRCCPSLGEQSVDQRPIDALVSGRPWASGESEELATLLGSGRMAALLSRLLWERVVLPEETTAMVVGRVAVEVDAGGRRGDHRGGAVARHLPGGPRALPRPAGRPPRDAGDGARRAAATPRDPAAVASAVRQTKEYQRLADRCWPRQTPEALVAAAVQEPAAAAARWPATCCRAGRDRPARRLLAGRDARGDDAQRVRAARRGARR